MTRRVDIYLGRSIPGGGRVRAEDLALWLDRTVTPIFPGFTLTHGTGYWERQREDCVVLTILVDDRVEWIDAQLAARRVAWEYKQRFHQESVLWTVSECEMEIV
jgi:hypothetical protein